MALYFNVLGGLEPKASITIFGGSYGKGGYLLLSTIAINNPHKGTRWDNTPGNIAHIAPWAKENGYQITESSDIRGAYCANLIHTETEKAQAEAFAEQAKLFDGAETGYLRLGDIPAGGRSYNNTSKKYEAGVSVFDAEFAADGSFRPVFHTPQEKSSYLSTSYVEERPVYRVWGDIVGYGGDGEPLLKITKKQRLLTGVYHGKD